MTVAGIAMVRDEDDIVGAIVAHMLEQVDFVIVADNGSIDDTRTILEGLAGDLTIVDDPDPAYRQSAKMTALAALAHDRGAERIVPFDADEWWYSPFGRIADVLSELGPQWLATPATVYDHVATGLDPDVGDPIERMEWRRRDPLGLPKVACRWRDDLVIGQGNHRADYAGGTTTTDALLIVRHFPYRSAGQLVRKVRNGAAAYAAMTDVPADMGTHWRQWGELDDEAIGDVFRKWYWRADPRISVRIDGELQPPLVHDPVSAL